MNKLATDAGSSTTSTAIGSSSPTDARDGHTSPTSPGSPSSSGSGSNNGSFPHSFTANPGVAGHIKDFSPMVCFLQLFNQWALELHKKTLRYLEQYMEDNKESLTNTQMS